MTGVQCALPILLAWLQWVSLVRRQEDLSPESLVAMKPRQERKPPKPRRKRAGNVNAAVMTTEANSAPTVVNPGQRRGIASPVEKRTTRESSVQIAESQSLKLGIAPPAEKKATREGSVQIAEKAVMKLEKILIRGIAPAAIKT